MTFITFHKVHGILINHNKLSPMQIKRTADLFLETKLKQIAVYSSWYQKGFNCHSNQKRYRKMSNFRNNLYLCETIKLNKLFLIK